jgi:hypothetical protein
MLSSASGQQREALVCVHQPQPLLVYSLSFKCYRYTTNALFRSISSQNDEHSDIMPGTSPIWLLNQSGGSVARASSVKPEAAVSTVNC